MVAGIVKDQNWVNGPADAKLNVIAVAENAKARHATKTLWDQVKERLLAKAVVILREKGLAAMSETGERLKSQLSQLSEKERADIASFLLESLEEKNGDDYEDEAAFDAELMRRLEEIESGKAVGIPWEQVRAEMREKYGWKQHS